MGKIEVYIEKPPTDLKKHRKISFEHEDGYQISLIQEIWEAEDGQHWYSAEVDTQLIHPVIRMDTVQRISDLLQEVQRFEQASRKTWVKPGYFID